jgi:hypothetical protein
MANISTCSQPPDSQAEHVLSNDRSATPPSTVIAIMPTRSFPAGAISEDMSGWPNARDVNVIIIPANRKVVRCTNPSLRIERANFSDSQRESSTMPRRASP